MNDFYNKVDVRNISTYSIKDAGQYLRIPISTVRSWTIGLNYHTKEGSSFFAPLIEIPKQKPYLLSFTNIVELHVLRAIRISECLFWPRKICLDRIWRIFS